jgi:hypothetical protein
VNTAPPHYHTAEKIKPSLPSDFHIDMGVSFLSRAEFVTCRKIYDFMRKNNNDVFISLPYYAQDYIFLNRLSAFLKSSKSYPIIINQTHKTALDIITHILQAFDIKNSSEPLLDFSRLLVKSFDAGDKIILMIMGAEHFSAETLGDLTKISELIYEKYPDKLKQTLFRFIFLGHKNSYESVISVKNKNIFSIQPEYLSENDCKNALYLYKDSISLPYQQNMIPHHHRYNDLCLLRGSAGYFVCLRSLFPLCHKLLDEHDSDNIILERTNHYATHIYDTLPEPQDKQSFQTDFHDFITASGIKKSISMNYWIWGGAGVLAFVIFMIFYSSFK